MDAGSFINQGDRIRDTSLHRLFKTHGRFFLDDENDYHVIQQNDKRLSIEKLVSFTDVLLQYGANPNLRNEEGETPYSLANTMQNKEVLELINMACGKDLHACLFKKKDISYAKALFFWSVCPIK